MHAFFSIDATLSRCMARFVNDSPYGNCHMRKFVIQNVPHLCLVALKDIEEGVELRYDYNDKNENLPWRKTVSKIYYNHLNYHHQWINNHCMCVCSFATVFFFGTDQLFIVGWMDVS